MAQPVQRPVVGVLARYVGVFRPHWEIPCIVVRVSGVRKLFVLATLLSCLVLAVWFHLFETIEIGMFLVAISLLAVLPVEEHWALQILPNSGFEVINEEGGPITFEGVVSERGSYGHKGIIHREVVIHRVLDTSESEIRL
jgi:hypothetical protein